MAEQIHPAELADWFAQDHAMHAVVLDVREPWEMQVARVVPDGFTLVEIPMGQIPARLGELEASHHIACLCHHGVRSQQVAAFLSQRGFAHVANIVGGIDAWAREHDPTVPLY